MVFELFSSSRTFLTSNRRYRTLVVDRRSRRVFGLKSVWEWRRRKWRRLTVWRRLKVWRRMIVNAVSLLLLLMLEMCRRRETGNSWHADTSGMNGSRLENGKIGKLFCDRHLLTFFVVKINGTTIWLTEKWVLNSELDCATELHFKMQIMLVWKLYIVKVAFQLTCDFDVEDKLGSKLKLINSTIFVK